MRDAQMADPLHGLPDGAWARLAHTVLEHMGVRAEDGLSGEQATRRLARHGRNALRQRPGRPCSASCSRSCATPWSWCCCAPPP